MTGALAAAKKGDAKDVWGETEKNLLKRRLVRSSLKWGCSGLILKP